jgi:hypothetical protein
MMKKFGLSLLAAVLLLIAAVIINPTINPSHDKPYEALIGETIAPAPNNAEVLQRIILVGDAGHSALDPLQASIKKIITRANVISEKTTIVVLGDNIYMAGYPQLEDQQTEFNEDQLESISFLDAQLEAAKQSKARMIFVPGNHDWYATEVDSQAQHIENYSAQHLVDTSFKPYNKDGKPIPQSIDLDGVSIVFLDSEWLRSANVADRKNAFTALDTLLTKIRLEQPDNLILITAHHPLETSGPHNGYVTSFGYWFMINLIDLFYDIKEQDVTHPDYASMIDGINKITSNYDHVIYAGGHDHSLQVFRRPHDYGPEYTIVSGAGNTSKVSGVWHSDNTRFALAQEGFIELNITESGTHLSVFDINNENAVSQFWLAF